MKYIYNGTNEVILAGYGLVRKREVIDVNFEVKNPKFVPYQEQVTTPPKRVREIVVITKVKKVKKKKEK